MPTRYLGLWSGVGLVAANMIGTGVFVGAAFTVQSMSAGWVLAGWVVGAVLAMAGAWCYAAIARRLPRSGGEYRYLRELVHPVLGHAAGWASLLVGFAAPVAINAVAAADFLDTVVHVGPSHVIAAALIAAVTLSHALDLRTSKLSQDALVVMKMLLVVGFTVFGLAAGSLAWPAWAPPGGAGGSPDLEAFLVSLFFVAFAFSGWNATIYAAEEFREPERDVPRAMLVGCALVGVLYLLMNWVFLANLTPETARLATERDVVTLAHLVTVELAGEAAGRAMSILTFVVMVSTLSAMTLIGPRVCAAMAADGYLPRALATREGHPPTGAILLQSATGLVLVFSHPLRDMLQNVGAVLVLFSALTIAGLFRLRPRPSVPVLTAAGLYLAFSGWMLYFGFKLNPSLYYWVGGILGAAGATHLAAAAVRRSG